MVGEYWYCAAKLLHQHVLGRVETLSKLVGSERHEEQAQETLAQLGRLVKVAMPDTLSDLMKAMRRQVSRALASRQMPGSWNIEETRQEKTKTKEKREN